MRLPWPLRVFGPLFAKEGQTAIKKGNHQRYALGFSAADLADTSLVIVWQQSLSLDNAGETLRLTYQKTSGDPVQLVDELHYGNALGGADSLSARLADTRKLPRQQMEITFLAFS